MRGNLKILFAVILFCVMFAGQAMSFSVITRLSNPFAVSGQADGLQQGGDRENSYAWCMDILSQPDGDYLYVGSNRDLMYLFLMASLMAGNFPPEITIDYLCNTIFQGDIAAATDLRGRIFRWKTDGTVDWELVYTSPLLPASIFPEDLGYRGALTFSDESGTDTGFYVVTTAFPVPGVTIATRLLKFPHDFVPGNEPKEVLRIASQPGQSNTLRPITRYNGKIYVGTSTNTIYESALPPEQPPSGWPFDSSTIGWNQIATDEDFGFPWQNYKYICWQFQEYSGYLYVIIGSIEPDNHVTHGFLLFRGKHDPSSPQANEAGWVWTEIIGDNGFYPPGMGSVSQGVASMAVFNGYLYIGTYNDVLGPLVTQGPDGIISSIHPPRIFRLDENNNCQMIIGDTDPDSEHPFLRTRLGNYGSGFYNKSIAQLLFPEPYNQFNYSLNQYIWWMEVYNGKLYCATFDIRSFLKYINDETLIAFGIEDPVARERILQAAEMLAQANNNPAGFDMYFTYDGVNWQPLTRDGFGDQFNYGARVMKATKSEMYVGTANPFYGCQVWKVSEPGSGGGGGNCFIATAAFGTPLAKQVYILREFRDKFLMPNRWGRKFIVWYYAHGPALAESIENHPHLKFMARILLYPIIIFCWICVYGILPYIIMVFALFSMFLRTRIYTRT
ncbi:MAG: hypothetical protein NC831_07490 [Candidatus Omnitrophica bacterium]|nr:hypothetical protein [Candidatus Omnitrophota bacterium]MCM8829006.1 hypothetical protein [Candidatus Omnitrophota bacterium]